METLAAQKVMNLKCFHCRKPNHMKKECRLPIRPRQPPTATNFKEKGKPPGPCLRCKKGNHWLNECKSKYDKNRESTITKERLPVGKLKTGPSAPHTKKGIFLIFFSCRQLHNIVLVLIFLVLEIWNFW